MAPSLASLSWGLILLALATSSALREEDEACQSTPVLEVPTPALNLLQRNSHPEHGEPEPEMEMPSREMAEPREAEPMRREAEPMPRREAEPVPRSEEGFWREPKKEGAGEGEGASGGEPCCTGSPCKKSGLRLELYLRPPLRYIHGSAQGPIGSFMAELKARILFALDLPPESVQMLGIRGNSLGKKVKFNMLQVSDSTFIESTFAKTEREYAAMLEQAEVSRAGVNSTVNSTANSSAQQAWNHAPKAETPPPQIGQYNTPVVIEGVIRPAEGMEAEGAEGEEKKEGEGKEGGEESAYTTGWRTHDGWRGKSGTVDPDQWNFQGMTINGAGSYGSQGGGASPSNSGWQMGGYQQSGWRVWDPATGGWSSSGSSEGEGSPWGYGSSRSGGGEEGEGGEGGSNGMTLGSDYQTVVDFEIMPGKEARDPTWAIRALMEETMDPSGRLMRGSLAPLLAFARLRAPEGKNMGTVEALLQIENQTQKGFAHASKALGSLSAASLLAALARYVF
mmetsp:Transcript_51442/g.122307  ORF Transcript_51442/g.122307 Transcript_51442/m.122307 type:complete len:508 (+) Transcript_51442:165-1688(+)